MEEHGSSEDEPVQSPQQGVGTHGSSELETVQEGTLVAQPISANIASSLKSALSIRSDVIDVNSSDMEAYKSWAPSIRQVDSSVTDGPKSNFKAAYLMCKAMEKYGIDVSTSSLVYKEIPLIPGQHADTHVFTQYVTGTTTYDAKSIEEDIKSIFGPKAIYIQFHYEHPGIAAGASRSSLRFFT